MNKIATYISGLMLLILLTPPAARAQEGGVSQFRAQEAVEETLSEAEQKLKGCLAGWRAFISSGVGYNDFLDYFRDFTLRTAHYADVTNVENQLNKVRYAVMAAFLRCDTDRLKSVTQSYYRLSAELHFVRHFVESEDGALRIAIDSSVGRQKLLNEIIDTYASSEGFGEDEEKNKALLSSWFEQFEARYRPRVKAYAGLGGDSVWEELSEKFKELRETFTAFNELGNELVSLGNEAVVEPAKAVGKATVSLVTNPKSALADAATFVKGKFDVCAETGDNKYCVFGENRTGGEGDLTLDEITPGVFAIFPALIDAAGDIYQAVTYDDDEEPLSEEGKEEIRKDLAARKREQEYRKSKKGEGQLTYEDIQRAEQAIKEIKADRKVESDLRARYDLLYGSVSGDGVRLVVEKSDDLIALLSKGRTPKQDPKVQTPAKPLPGSLPFLEAVAQCAKVVRESVCK